jgi:hypothetical protein
VKHQHAGGEQSDRMPRVIVDRRLPHGERIRREATLQRMRTERAACDGDRHQQRSDGEREAGRHFRLHWQARNTFDSG